MYTLFPMRVNHQIMVVSSLHGLHIGCAFPLSEKVWMVRYVQPEDEMHCGSIHTDSKSCQSPLLSRRYGGTTPPPPPQPQAGSLPRHTISKPLTDIGFVLVVVMDDNLSHTVLDSGNNLLSLQCSMPYGPGVQVGALLINTCHSCC